MWISFSRSLSPIPLRQGRTACLSVRTKARCFSGPGGHGALIYNLNRIEDEFVSIKNIDNVAIERFLPQTSLYKKVLLGQLVSVRDRIHGYLRELDEKGQDAPLQEMVSFFADSLCTEIPESLSGEDRAAYLRRKLDRPIRVCGMVRNQGEPGGGPFIIREKDGSTSLQILENDQIDKGNPDAVAKLAASHPFQPCRSGMLYQELQGRKIRPSEIRGQRCGPS